MEFNISWKARDSIENTRAHPARASLCAARHALPRWRVLVSQYRCLLCRVITTPALRYLAAALCPDRAKFVVTPQPAVLEWAGLCNTGSVAGDALALRRDNDALALQQWRNVRQRWWVWQRNSEAAWLQW
jgi:hypothetical protein